MNHSLTVYFEHKDEVLKILRDFFDYTIIENGDSSTNSLNGRKTQLITILNISKEDYEKIIDIKEFNLIKKHLQNW